MYYSMVEVDQTLILVMIFFLLIWAQEQLFDICKNGIFMIKIIDRSIYLLRFKIVVRKWQLDFL